ncbi:LOW QUALITY PROTEIN: eukaryotic translation initiation factor 5B [Arabidopsis lyrata subsp. lyrata]|uniref:LOW QUALITY PROTEIN: eukaryotic translation initiation factor 5B n=1 Tax=Arabidopsis lyrata subsp. lyrata TaxID=81972 RepID=UPI000A29A8A0|nr:LOW QUALITY PROTEIN: eukaryotic translation initiation factor 5B [Arabidopsis lyrata subsp. lyrata]|eukprot:XP_020870275.1 LOW QUALITY PROTEIN: eukaryotic translation initiation factor 5B [Arabidopsis lyrata subsp. lyrata]
MKLGVAGKPKIDVIKAMPQVDENEVAKEVEDNASKSHDSVPGADRPTVKPGVAGKPKTNVIKAMPRVDENEVAKEVEDNASKSHDSVPGADRPTVKPGVVGKPKTDVIKAMPQVDENIVAKEVEENLRSPICCIMGHVDSGKTKLLDCIRGTNVQEGEAGVITQQISATYFPAENIRERTKELRAGAKLKLSGLLVIDTPGHESFTNLWSRGSNLCDFSIPVVDIMCGLEPQTLESLNLLRRRNVKFVVALNKVDTICGWKKSKNAPLLKTMKQQSRDVVNEFNMRVDHVKTQFQEQGINCMLYYKNKEMEETICIVPTSAISGEGIPDPLMLLVLWAQKTMVEKLTYVDKVQCTVLEVKVIESHGITVDVVLLNGVLREADQIVVCGSQGPIVTTIRSLLTPYPMNETRVKGTYMAHREVKAAQGIKIAAPGLEHAIAGTTLHVIGPNEDMEEAKKNAMEDIESVMNRIDKSGEGVNIPNLYQFLTSSPNVESEDDVLENISEEDLLDGVPEDEDMLGEISEDEAGDALEEIVEDIVHEEAVEGPVGVHNIGDVLRAAWEKKERKNASKREKSPATKARIKAAKKKKAALKKAENRQAHKTNKGNYQGMKNAHATIFPKKLSHMPSRKQTLDSVRINLL